MYGNNAYATVPYGGLNITIASTSGRTIGVMVMRSKDQIYQLVLDGNQYGQMVSKEQDYPKSMDSTVIL